MTLMNNVGRDIQRKLRALRHAEQIGDITKTCRYFGIGRASFIAGEQPSSAKGKLAREIVEKFYICGRLII
jgi:hypothetical protein